MIRDISLSDGVTLSGTRLTNEGYLISEAFAVRTGIQLYTGDEVDPTGALGLKDKPIVRVYRSEEEVRSTDSLRSFSHAPVTVGHPVGGVTSDSWKALAVGEVSTEATWDGNKIKLPLIIKDKAAVNTIQSGTRELSAGYLCQLDATPGETPDGQPYDAKQTNIRINHLAIVPHGRAGSECRIGDAGNWGNDAPIEKEAQPVATKPVVIGDQVVNVTTEDADKVTKFIADMRASHQAAIDANQAAMAAKDAEIAKLTASQLSDADLDARVAQRADLVANAKLIAPTADFAGLSDADLRKKAVVSLDAAFADKSAAYIDAMFDIKLGEAKAKVSTQQTADGVMKTFVDHQTGQKTTMGDELGYGAREQAMLNAWAPKQGA